MKWWFNSVVSGSFNKFISTNHAWQVRWHSPTSASSQVSLLWEISMPWAAVHDDGGAGCQALDMLDTHNTTRQYSTTHHMVPVLHTKIHELIIICKTSNNCCGVDCIISSQNMKTSSTAVTKFSRFMDLFWSILRRCNRGMESKKLITLCWYQKWVCG